MNHFQYQSISMKPCFEILFKMLATKPGRRRIAAGSCISVEDQEVARSVFSLAVHGNRDMLPMISTDIIFF